LIAYEPNQSICWPSVAPVSLVLWTDLYLRFVVENSQAKRIKQKIQAMVNSEKELRSRVVRLRKQLTDLKKEHDELNENGEQKMNNDNSNNNAPCNPLINGAI
jgi:myotubularin-related protein 9